MAVFIFAKNLTDKYGDNPFKTEFKKSKYYTQKYRDLISQLDTLRIDYTYPFTEFPFGSKVPEMTEGILKKNVLISKNIADFKLRSAGLITNSALNQLANTLLELTPIYNELIFYKNKVKFENRLTAISDYITTKNISGYFETGLIFYNSVWDNSLPFEIAFYPLPDSNGFTAEAFCSNNISKCTSNRLKRLQ